jgi:2-phosphosulfolactate phosphatase
MIYDQAAFDIRCEWGLAGMRHLARVSDVVIVVDVLSFSTSVEIAVSRGAVVFAYRWDDETAHDFAVKVDAIVADHKNEAGFNLSPASLIDLPGNSRLVLPSPNGSTICLAAGEAELLIGSLKNCKAVA